MLLTNYVMISVFAKADPFEDATAACEISTSAFDAAIEEFNNGDLESDLEAEEDM